MAPETINRVGDGLPRLIAVVGATASGKSSLAMRLAAELGGEIVCCDSMQVYRGMDIGTAKPTQEDRSRVTHHCVDFRDPSSSYSCAEYAADASEAVSDILSRGRCPIICGGTGLYLEALLFERPWKVADGRTPVRDRLAAEAAEEGGAQRLYSQLCTVDPECAQATHENNLRRVIRALEIYELTGRKKSELDRASGQAKYDSLVIYLRYPDRAALYERIGKRVDDMLEHGLADEVRRLKADGVFERNLTAAQAIGYKELLGMLDGQTDAATARERLITATRRYAKRQMTWFSSRDYIRTVNVTADEPDPYPAAAALLREWLKDGTDS